VNINIIIILLIIILLLLIINNVKAILPGVYPGIWIRGHEGMWSPLPSPRLPSPSHLLPLEVDPLIQLEDLGERCKLPQRGLGRSPSRN